jgi:hypothetical protein
MANILCRQHPLTADHVTKIATLIDERIGVLIGDAALKSKVADLAPWYELRGIIAQMQNSTADKVDPAAEKKTRAPRVKLAATASPAAAKGPEGEIGGTGGAE